MNELTPKDLAALQRARRSIEQVKAALYSGQRGEEWQDHFRATFDALTHAETLLSMVVVGNGSPESRDQSILAYLAAMQPGSK